MKSECIRWLVGLFVILACRGALSQESTNVESMVRLAIWDVATRSPSDEEQPRDERLLKLTAQRGIPKEVLEQVLLEYADAKGLPERYGENVEMFSLWMLSEMRCQKALRIYKRKLEEAETRKDTSGRQVAIIGIMKIGGAEAIAIAKTILSDLHSDRKLDRFYVYENLAKHLTRITAPQTESEFRAEVKKLFTEKIEEETDPAGIEEMDRALTAESSEYRTSDRREKILKKHANTNLPIQRKYIEESLIKMKEWGRGVSGVEGSDSMKGRTSDE